MAPYQFAGSEVHPAIPQTIQGCSPVSASLSPTESPVTETYTYTEGTTTFVDQPVYDYTSYCPTQQIVVGQPFQMVPPGSFVYQVGQLPQYPQQYSVQASPPHQYSVQAAPSPQQYSVQLASPLQPEYSVEASPPQQYSVQLAPSPPQYTVQAAPSPPQQYSLQAASPPQPQQYSVQAAPSPPHQYSVQAAPSPPHQYSVQAAPSPLGDPQPPRSPSLKDGQSISTQLEVIWHGTFDKLFKNFPIKWKLMPVTTIPNDAKTFMDSAKVRFICPNCQHCWTSMKGRVTFGYSVDSLQKEGLVVFRLYGQKCSKCNSPEWVHSMWYEEEVKKVIYNIHQHVAMKLYSARHPKLRIERRKGRPSKPHDPSSCQACDEGVCREERNYC